MCFGLKRVTSLVIAILCLIAFACSAVKPVRSRGAFDATEGKASSPSAQSSAAATGTGDAAYASRPEQALAKIPVTAADPQWGSVDAPVTIVEFSDFQCPFCGRVAPTLEQLKQKYGPSQLRLVFKHNPLPFHQEARPAAEAAAAVFMLAGSRAFFEFHDFIFQNQPQLSRENLETWAASVGVRAPALRAWLETGRAAQKVDQDIALAAAVGANGTPGFRINGKTVSGAQPLEVFVAAVDEQLAAARALTQSGTPPRLVYVTLTDKNVELAPAQPTAAAAREKADEPDTTVWALPVSADDPARGPSDALVTIVQFSDYQCPFCKRVEATLSDLRQQYGKDLRIIWKDNPLPFHVRALPAAKFARAVWLSRGNDAFWKLHDALFENQASLEDDDFEELAKKQGLAWAALKAPIASTKIATQIADSQQLAEDFQARGTPHFFINGRRLSGSQPLAAFQKVVDEELAKARAVIDHGTPRAKLYAKLLSTAESPPPPEQRHLDVPTSSPSRGDAKAPIVIQEFSDFQCPFCKRVEPTLVELEKEFHGSIRVVWRHYPLPFHQYAAQAAEAAEEVLAQKGTPAFWAYHDLLYQAQGEPEGLDRVNLDNLADKLGVDMARFKAALDQHVHAAQVNADAAAAAKIGISGTPAFLIGDYYVSGAQPATVFRRLIKRALSEKKKP